MDEDFRATLRLVVARLDELGVKHYVGGSIASSHHGVGRSTADADFVVDIAPLDTARVCARMKEEFYLDDRTAVDAVREGKSFNLIHFDTAVKIDFFAVGSDPFRRSALSRAQRNEHGIPIATAEDIVLAKLRWYREGGESSERQWNDLLGVVRVQAGRLDEGYLDRWANVLGVADLLDRLRRGV